MRSLVLALLAIPLWGVAGHSEQPAASSDAWKDYRFLIGDWVGEGSKPSQGKGQFSFALDLQGKILVRKHRADLPATTSRPAATHEDLMVIYQQENGKGTQAIYFDSEGHVIHYTPSLSKDGRTLTFLSEVTPSLPRFRLSYAKAEGALVKIKFDIAPPGKPDAFKTYLEGSARRRERP